MEGRVKAIAAKDVDAAMANHAPEVVMFDVLNPLRYRGAATARDRTSTWFSSFQGPIGYEVRDPSITTSESAAFCHYLDLEQEFFPRNYLASVFPPGPRPGRRSPLRGCLESS